MELGVHMLEPGTYVLIKSTIIFDPLAQIISKRTSYLDSQEYTLNVYNTVTKRYCQVVYTTEEFDVISLEENPELFI